LTGARPAWSPCIALPLAYREDDATYTRPAVVWCPVTIDAKLRFLRFLRIFFNFQTFFSFSKNVGKVQSGKQINKKHLQNDSDEIDL